jgi:hypothetical protein
MVNRPGFAGDSGPSAPGFVDAQHLDVGQRCFDDLPGGCVGLTQEQMPVDSGITHRPTSAGSQ